MTPDPITTPAADTNSAATTPAADDPATAKGTAATTPPADDAGTEKAMKRTFNLAPDTQYDHLGVSFSTDGEGKFSTAKPEEIAAAEYFESEIQSSSINATAQP